jgi:hypothetical protein
LRLSVLRIVRSLGGRAVRSKSARALAPRP